MQTSNSRVHLESMERLIDDFGNFAGLDRLKYTFKD